jgi:hypothetical protein
MRFDATKIEDELARFYNGPPPTYIMHDTHESVLFYEANPSHKNLFQIMNNPPGNPTETELEKLNNDLTEYDEAIKKQKHIRWLAGVEITRIEKSRTATLKAIETITKGPES